MRFRPARQQLASDPLVREDVKRWAVNHGLSVLSFVVSLVALAIAWHFGRIASAPRLVALTLTQTGLRGMKEATNCQSRLRLVNLGGAAESIVGLDFAISFNGEKAVADSGDYSFAGIEAPFHKSAEIKAALAGLSIADEESDPNDDDSEIFQQAINLPLSIEAHSSMDVRVNTSYKYDFERNPYGLTIDHADPDRDDTHPIVFSVVLHTASGDRVNLPAIQCWAIR